MKIIKVNKTESKLIKIIMAYSYKQKIDRLSEESLDKIIKEENIMLIDTGFVITKNPTIDQKREAIKEFISSGEEKSWIKGIKKLINKYLIVDK